MVIEDIFNEAATSKDIYLKYGSYTIENFDKPQNNNALKFLELKERLNDKELHCFFAKKTEDELFVIVPMEEIGGQIEFVVTYSNFFLEIKVKSRKKSRFNNNVVIPDPQYAFEQLCTIHFVEDVDKDCISIRDLLTNEELAKQSGYNSITEVNEIVNKWITKEKTDEEIEEIAGSIMGLVNDTYFVDSNNKLNFVYTVAAAGTYDRSMAVDEIKDVQINNNKN